MRRNLSLSLAALLLLGVASQAQAKEFKGFVYNGQTGWASVKYSGLEDDALGSNSNIGYRWGFVGVEVGHVWFSTFEDDRHYPTADYETEADIGGWNAGLTFNSDLNDKWAVQLRAGAFNWDLDGSVDSTLPSHLDLEDDGTDWYVGASATWNWTKRSSIGIGYTRYRADKTDIDVIGFSSEYRFGAK
jgi:hypothetical protein